MERLLRILQALNYVFGLPVIVLGIVAYIRSRALVPLLLGVALAIAGPLEDLLKRFLRLPGVPPEQTRQLVDLGTSLAFVLLLLAAVLLTS